MFSRIIYQKLARHKKEQADANEGTLIGSGFFRPLGSIMRSIEAIEAAARSWQNKS